MSALDPTVAGQLAEDLPPDVFRTIIATFEEDMTRLLQELQDAYAAGNQDGYERAAHSLAGASAAVGALGLEREARIAMDHRQPEAAVTVLPRLVAEAKGALEALHALIH
ncbi:Hpt domain-containing protein [Roseococcus sp.]|uniref:Hpt domain-containing protein n=1 Tax=Roseococcus sp. TaxID=2109646 RepID=UPI003BAD5259